MSLFPQNCSPRLVCFYGLLAFLLLANSAGAGNLLFIRDKGLWLSDSFGKSQRRLDFFGGKEIISAALSPDGERVVAAVGRDNLTGLSAISLLQLKDSVLLPLSLGSLRAACSPNFSADGKSVVLVGASDCKRTADAWAVTISTMLVAIVSLDGGVAKTVVSTPDVVLDTGYVYDNPALSPNGKHLAYQESGSDVSGGFVIVDMHGKILFRYPVSGSGYPAFWKPQFINSKQVLCWSPDVSGGGDNTIYIVNIKDGTRRKLAKGANPALVDGGQAIVFERWEEIGNDYSPSNLWRLNLKTGAKPERIVLNAHHPAGAAH